MHLVARWRGMAKHIEVIYTNGVFRPAAPLELELAEGQHLTLILPENGTEWEPLVEDEDLRQMVCRAGWRAGTQLRGRTADTLRDSRVHGGRCYCRT